MRHRTAITSVLVTAAVMLVLVGVTPGAAAAEASLTEILQHHDLAVFEWQRLSQVNTTVTNQRLSALRQDGFTTIYVDISEYVEVADQRRTPSQQARLAQLKGELKGFVDRAGNLGLAVHAVAGAPNWTDQARRHLAPMTVDLVVAYNNTAGEDQLQGVQFDIEPYVERTWWKNVKASLKAYLSTVRAVVDRYNQVAQPDSNGLQLGVAIPFWYDGTPEVPAVEFGPQNKSAPAAFHLIDMLGGYPEAYLVVLAYRNFASDEDPIVDADGSIALVSGEFDYANSSGAACGIVIGQEFGLVDPKKVSFGWVGRAAFREAAGELVDAYGEQAPFRGLAVNDLDFYEATPEYVPE